MDVGFGWGASSPANPAGNIVVCILTLVDLEWSNLIRNRYLPIKGETS